ncbi:MAG TPA: PepSY domain-containing protein [Zeimonas sp.]
MTLPILRPFALSCAAACALAATPAASAEPHVRIEAPSEGAKLDAMEQNRLVYEVEPGPRGDHVHVYVDGKEVGILRQLKGSYTLETLSPGPHELCVKVVNKGHTPVGVQDCIEVRVE